jgi:hypothetical protein
MLGLGASCVRESNQFDRAASEVKPLRVVGVDGLQQAAVGDGTSGSRCDRLNDQAVVALINQDHWVLAHLPQPGQQAHLVATRWADRRERAIRIRQLEH